ncbi:STAS domain-containing protein [Streptomyces virginiae]|uniref:STAS domain-containing protein n=1 Tax=Streptomyces virginiae TaxID=1961 RepID=UPI0032532B5A
MEVALRGEIRAQDAPLVGSALARPADDAPPQIRIDLGHAGELNATTGGAVFFPLLARARLHGTVVIVHHASTRTRAKLRELGLDHCVACPDTSP